MKISNYTIPELNKIKELANFTSEEEKYFNLKAKDYSNVKIAREMSVSEALVSKLAKRVKSKMLRVL